MNIETLTTLLGWSTVINWGILFLWFLMMVIARNWVYQVHTQWFNINKERFEEIHYQLMGLYKLMIILFNLVPYIVLRVVIN